MRWHILLLVLVFITACTSINLAQNETASQEPVPIATVPPPPPLPPLPPAVVCSAPQVNINNACCDDANQNSVCDNAEAGPICNNQKCEQGENECSCPNDCGTCGSKGGAAFYQEWQCADAACVLKDKAVFCGNGVCDSGEACGDCYQDCCTPSFGLGRFPNISAGWQIVLGDKAPSTDVAVGSGMATWFVAHGYVVSNTSRLASEVTDVRGGNYLVIGNPCDNALARELLREEIYQSNGNCQIFRQNESLIKLLATSPNNTSILYFGGHSVYDTERAALVLKQHEKYRLNGSAILVSEGNNASVLTVLR